MSTETPSSQRIKASVRLQDTETEGRPSIYLFIFVNPVSGNRQGGDLIHLPIQHFRLRRLPQVQVEIHNYLDPRDREAGMNRVKLIESKVKADELPNIEAHVLSPADADQEQATSNTPKLKGSAAEAATTFPEGKGVLSSSAKTRHIHVWSAGGDGTVMSIFGLLEEYQVDLDLVYFSCNQVLGWGRTTTRNDVLGYHLSDLETLICDRLECAEAARLDIWKVVMESYDSGYVRDADSDKTQKSRMVRMCNYMSIGVQGYVGSGFEKHRTKKRLMNILVYTLESSKWVFWRKFPSINHFVESFVYNGQRVLTVPSKPGQERQNSSSASLNNSAIDLVIQNIPHIWGREVDLWGEAQEGLESVTNRCGFTDPEKWTPQLANDGKLEVIALESMVSYIKKLINMRKHVSRVGQFEGPFEIQFRDPTHGHQRKDSGFACFGRPNWYERKNLVGIMCDGEFYMMKDPRSIKFERAAQVWTLGRNDAQGRSRLYACLAN
ncbi:diacylglycerol kinase accessory domain-containing protein [Dichotomocladium elegans]|nr:diacylglycerol kinase accessory domain-containing protein [Dichotomocladium elegans]